tara:strand:- start:301 stop:2670 length:2370 start_codon:yes stop_codon:yes gene_type:complete
MSSPQPKRTIQSPGVEIRESDLSLRVPSKGTTIYITGYANDGPTDEAIGVSSITEFENIFGAPRTPAERYFYHTVRAALNSTGKCIVNRLPYGTGSGTGFGSKISVLAYPASGYDRATSRGTADLSKNDSVFFLGQPKQFNITQAEYLSIKDGSAFSLGWGTNASPPSEIASLNSLSGAAVLVVNKAQTVIDNQFAGYYTGISDNTLINPASAFESIRTAKTVTAAAAVSGTTAYTTIPTSRLEFSLSASPDGGDNPATNSISQVIEDKVTNFDIAGREFDDTLNVGVFKLRQSVFSKEAQSLDYLLEDATNGSIGYYRQRNSENGGAPVNISLGNTGDTSRNIDIIVNPYLADQLTGLSLSADGTPTKKIRVMTQNLVTNYQNGNVSDTVIGGSLGNSTVNPLSGNGLLDDVRTNIGDGDSLFPLGAYGETNLETKITGDMPAKLTRALDAIRNDRKYDIDIIAEGGLGTIWVQDPTSGGKNYDDTKTTSAIEALRTPADPTDITARTNYTTIFNKFNVFCGPAKDGGRGDILFIADPIRQILVTGKGDKVQDNKDKNFSSDIYWALKHQFSLANTSYSTVYANYMQVYDSYSGLLTYVPSSGFAAAKMASTDASVGQWGAPAGFNRGIIQDASDIALTPNQRQRDELYISNLNPIANFVDQGNVIFGQKTLLRKPSAFDRINVRRTFLYLEKLTKKTMQFFLFENNTLFTRTRVLNTLTPFFERVKADDGLHDYMIVCDERNNTPEVIDRNELVVDIYLKPVRTAEFILVNFYATRTDANFEEIIGG